jgi:hypothetical protein
MWYQVFWSRLGTSWNMRGTYWNMLGTCLEHLGTYLEHLGTSWNIFGAGLEYTENPSLLQRCPGRPRTPSFFIHPT